MMEHGLQLGQHVADSTGRTGVVTRTARCEYAPCKVDRHMCVEVLWDDARVRSMGTAADAATLTPFSPELVAAITATLEGAR